MDGSQLTSWYEVAKGEVPLPLTGPSLNLSPLPAPHPPTIFLFGGKLVVQRRLTAEMWAFDINTRTWSRVNAGKGPGARYFHSMDVWEDKLVCFGGMADNDPHSEKLNVHNDVWLFDCRSRRWLPQPSPEAPIPDDKTILGSAISATPDAPQDEALLPTPRYAHLSAISRGKLIVCGGQRLDNSWIYEMNVYDLERNLWVSKTDQPVSHGLHSKGAYRSVTASSPYRVVVPTGDSYTMTGAPALPYTVDEEGSGGDVWCYSNYDFAKVRRELEVLSPTDRDTGETPTTSEKFASPPGFTMNDICTKVGGSSQPPGLRFPTGGIIGNHFVLCGLYLASTSAAFSIWTLDLTKHTWKHIEPPVLASGSWNIVVPDPMAARLLIFGNAQSDLATDYSKRAVSLNHFAVVELEAFGVYQAPKLLLSEQTQDMGLTMLDEKLVSDFDIVCEDGRRIRCSRKVLTERWPWFAEQQAMLVGKAGDMVHEMPSLDIKDALLGSLSPARFTPNRLHLPEPLPVCVALIQYFYTLNLSTPLQNRAPVLCALLFLSKQYKIERLGKLVIHALHCRLEPSNAIQVYEVAALAGEQNLSARALAMVNPKSSSSSRHGHRRPTGTSSTDSGPNSASHHPASSNLGTLGSGGSGSQKQHPPPMGSGHGPNDGGDGEHRTHTATAVSEKEERAAATSQLMNALSINAPPPMRSPVNQLPPPIASGSVSRTVSNESLSRSLPPLLPPPGRPPPIRPEFEAFNPSTPEHYHQRPYSPTSTYSEVGSMCPRTPSEAAHPLPIISRDSPASIGSTSAKKSLPALLEHGHLLAPERLDTHYTLEMCDAELESPGVETISTAPLDGDLSSQQARAMDEVVSKLTRTASLDSHQLNRSVVESSVGHTRTVSFRRPKPKVLDAPYEGDVAATLRIKRQTLHLAFAGSGSSASTASSSSFISSGSSLSSTSFSPRRNRPTSLWTRQTDELPEQHVVAKLQAFFEQQQQQHHAEGPPAADWGRSRARPKSRLSRLGARFADALLSA